MRACSLLLALMVVGGIVPWWAAASEEKAQAPVAPAASAAAATPPWLGPDVQDVVFFSGARPVLIRLHVYIDGKPFQALWEEYMRTLFQYLDYDGDGVLSQKEATRAPSALSLLQSVQAGIFGGQSFTAAPFTALDADKDGKVTVEELMSYYRRSGAGPLQSFPSPGLSPAKNKVTDILFAYLDRNKDGKLSQEEVAAAPAALRKLDVNDDELISVQEVMPGTAAFGVQFFAGPGQQPAVIDKPLFLAINPVDPPKRLSQVMFQHYGKDNSTAGGRESKDKARPPSPSPSLEGKGAGENAKPAGVPKSALASFLEGYLKLFDKPAPLKSQKLTRQEIGLDRAIFDLLDANKDGALDEAELEKFCQRPADIELVVRIGKTAEREPSHAVNQRREEGPLRSLVQTIDAASALITLGQNQIMVAGDGGAAPNEQFGKANEKAIRQFILQQFKAADTDKKGYIDMKQVSKPNFRFLQNFFRFADRDGDGKLYEKELVAYLDLQAKAPAGFTTLSITDQGPGLFELLDANRNGYLSPRELRTAWSRLAPWDRNGDGLITRAELPRQLQITVNRGRSAFGGRIIFFGAAAIPRPQAPSKGPLWFRKMDRNGDGDVSWREFLGSREDFKRIDTDGDGLIDADEAERADAWFQKRLSQAK